MYPKFVESETLGRETLEFTLKNLGLTKKETEIYILIAKRGAKKISQISKTLKKNKGLVYRILSSLQQKGFVEKTLESPTRYTAVPFEKVIDSFIKLRRQEAAQIEEAKKSLLSDWDRISQTELDSSLEKFSVIEGRKKIYDKISQMVKETEKQINVGLQVPDLLVAERLGVFDELNEIARKPRISFRVLTQFSRENLVALKVLNAKFNSFLAFRGTNPGLGLSSFSRLVIRDDEEIILFISNEQDKISGRQDDVCLLTNCKSLIQAFRSVFSNLWNNSTNIKQKILDLETGKPTPKMILIREAKNAKRKYYNFLQNAQDEIMIVTSSEGLIELYNQSLPLKDWSKRGVYIKIMAPIVEKNLEVSQRLLEFCEVKHVPVCYLGTTIIDGKHLFQFKHPPLVSEKLDSLEFFKNTLYTNGFEYIKKTLNMFKEIWRKACIPSAITIESIIVPKESSTKATDSPSSTLKNFRKVVTFTIEDQKIPGNLKEKDVLNKILKANKNLEHIDFSKANKLYASTGQAIIRPPDYFNLPSIMFHAFHIDDLSSHGGGDSLVVFLWLDTPTGFGYVPVAILTTNPKAATFEKHIFRGTPAEQNHHVVKKDELYVRVHGNNLFAGWTKTIPLFPPPYELPPSCLLLEGIGKVKTGRLELAYRSGYKNNIEFNAFEALVTFYHPSSKYSGPGTDGILFRDYVGEALIE